MPDDPILTFVNHAKMMKAPYIVYADTEALITLLKTTEETRLAMQSMCHARLVSLSYDRMGRRPESSSIVAQIE